MMLKENVVPRATIDQARTVERPPTRRGELDVLRALVVVGLVFFHSAVIFGPGEFPVKAETEHLVATVFLAFGATWGMPLLFTISGMGVWYSLRSRGPAGFARERLRRLGVPLLVGLLTLVPLQVWLGLRHSGDPAAGPGFYRRFWDVRPSLNFPFVVEAAPGGLFETGHLWFLVCLLGFSLVLLPGLRLLDRAHGQGPAAVLVLAVAIVAVEVLLGSEVGHGGWHHASYALFLVAGFLATADRRIGQAFQRRRRAAIVLAGLGFLASGAVYAAAAPTATPSPAWSLWRWRSGCSRPSTGCCGWWPSWVWPGAAAPGPGRRRPRPAASAPTSTRPCCRSTCCTRRSWWLSPTPS